MVLSARLVIHRWLHVDNVHTRITDVQLLGVLVHVLRCRAYDVNGKLWSRTLICSQFNLLIAYRRVVFFISPFQFIMVLPRACYNKLQHLWHDAALQTRFSSVRQWFSHCPKPCPQLSFEWVNAGPSINSLRKSIVAPPKTAVFHKLLGSYHFPSPHKSIKLTASDDVTRKTRLVIAVSLTSDHFNQRQLLFLIYCPTWPLTSSVLAVPPSILHCCRFAFHIR